MTMSKRLVDSSRFRDLAADIMRKNPFGDLQAKDIDNRSPFEGLVRGRFNPPQPVNAGPSPASPVRPTGSPTTTASQGRAMVDYFLKLEGIEGESRDQKHAAEIEVSVFNWGEQQAIAGWTGGGLAASKVEMSDFNIVMPVNKASPHLFQKCATGEHIPSAKLTCRKAGKEQQEYLTITFTDLLVSSYQTDGGSNDVLPTDQVSFNFKKVEFSYREQKADGTLGGAIKKFYDQGKNVSG